MSEATVPDLSDEPLEIRAQYPDRERWNTDRSELVEARKNELADALPDADVVGVVDSDSDGLACEVVLNEAYPDSEVVVIQGRGGKYGFDIEDSLSLVADHASEDATVVIADIAPDAEFSGYMAAVNDIDGEVHIYDHHDWEWYTKESLKSVTDHLVVDTDKCAAQVVQQELLPDADAHLQEFLEVTADHDLWKKEDERSDQLATLAYELERDEYVDAARTHGANMVEADDQIRKRYEAAEREQERRTQIAVDNAEWHTIHGYEVAITYLDCNQSEVGNQLIENGADIAVITKPTLSLSFRSAEDVPLSAELARRLGGGGHPSAAGANLYGEIDADFSDLWESGGRPALDYMENFLRTTLSDIESDE